MTVRRRITRSATLLVVGIAGASVWIASSPMSAGGATMSPVAGWDCNAPIFSAAQPNKDVVALGPMVDNGWARSYSVGVGSYLRRCGGYDYARHQIYVDTRNLPWGHKVWLTVTTQRSDGKWARSHRAPILELTGHQRIEEVILYQRRGIGGGRSVRRIKVFHTATTPGDGVLIPHGSTLRGVYRPWNGPEASPAD